MWKYLLVLFTMILYLSQVSGVTAQSVESPTKFEAISAEDIELAYLYFVDGSVPLALKKAINDKSKEKAYFRGSPINITFLTNWYRDSEVYTYSRHCPEEGYIADVSCFWKVWHADLSQKKYQQWGATEANFEVAANDLNGRKAVFDDSGELRDLMPIKGIKDPFETFKKNATVKSLNSKQCKGIIVGIEALKSAEPIVPFIYGSNTSEQSDEITITLHATTYQIELELGSKNFNSSGEIILEGQSGSKASDYMNILLDPLEKCKWKSE